NGTLRATDADDTALSFSLVEPLPTLGSFEIADPATGEFTYTPMAGAEGQEIVRFVATDGVNTSVPAFVTIDIGEPTGELAVTLFAPTTVDEGAPTRLEALISGADGSTATVRWDLDADGVFEEGFDTFVETRAPGDREVWTVAVELSDGSSTVTESAD